MAPRCGARSIEHLVGLDRKTVRRYVEGPPSRALAVEQAKPTYEAFMAKVCELARPRRPDGHVQSWAVLEAHHDQLRVWLRTRA